MQKKYLLSIILSIFMFASAIYAGNNDVTEVITIAEAKIDANNDLVPDLVGQTVTIQGLVMSPNYQTSNHSYYIQDATGGITTFFSGSTSPELNLGDEVEVTGVIGHYNGLTQLQPADGDAFTILSTGNTPYAPVILTVAEFLDNAEMYEGALIAIQTVTVTGGTWPASGSATLQITDATGTLDMRIDSDMDISGQPEPTWPRDVIGVAGQFDSQSPYDAGYQILPRYYDTDFPPAGSTPVELTSFSASVSGTTVTLEWSTATELNNKGFEIERKTDSDWSKVGYVEGKGTTNELNSYSFVNDVANLKGTVEYRLKQVDFDGTFDYSNVVSVEISSLPEKFELAQNYPNPFNPSTTITFTLPENGMTVLNVYDVLGNEVAQLVNETKDAGTYSVSFNASQMASGVYYYSIMFNGSVKTNKMMLMK